ncbi:retinitis pigmentosa 1-like 1 protein [Spea bombifrons]|uniref:retinitis pigmentosa 1-like 1 protein n=1 Tax=Spea bombifrons TaxID=233779 RepID=UPI002349DB49|nr:retinitis pigmentosa 1-like 1 protein [Spea bombifrons]
MNPTAAEGSMAAPFSPEQSLPPVPRPHAVSEVTPAKRITFFKSGDPQFGGVKMAINRRSFKSFSALMDDLSNRVPLPFGVRTITTPRGTHSINRLEQLKDGGRYVCSDKKYVQPIDLGGSGRKMGVHRPQRPISARRHGQQEDVDDDHPAADIPQAPKLRKKITLVKNGDPSVRRSIVLNRRNARSFKAFIEDASDLLQYSVRRLYTVDGRRIENMQGVLQSPAILICVGREPFKPIQVDNARKGAPEKLPGLRSHPGVTSEVMDNKKNANFGLKTKKSVIHPRSASSNKTRFSLSSDKSYPNGLNMSPVSNGFAAFADEGPHAKSDDTPHSLVNDDIEKKVHVNKDGSLSVEMKVRFRLLNEETLQWSTQIKKSSTLGKAKCEQLHLYHEDDLETKKQMDPENFSETDDSFYPCDAESYSSKLNDAELDDMYCSHCGMQCQEYDIWKNPLHIDPHDDYAKQSTWQTQSSTSSTSSHRRLRSNQDSLRTVSSEEYTEHVLHKSSSYSETRGSGETTVRYSAVSQCTCRSTQSVISNVDMVSESGCRHTRGYQNKSCPSPKSLCAPPNQCPGKFRGSKNVRAGSSEDKAETSPRPCSNGECQRVSAMSESSSRKCHRRMSTRSSTNPRSPTSNISCDEENQQGRGDLSTPTRNISRASSANSDFKDMGGGEGAEIPAAHEKMNSECNTESNELALDSSRTPGNGDEESSTRASSPSSKHSDKRRTPRINSGQKNTWRSCNSVSSSLISVEGSETLLPDAGRVGPCDEEVNLETSNLINSNVNSYADKRQQTLRSNHSLQSSSSVAESIPCHKQDDQPSSNSPDNCEESQKSHPVCKSQNNTASPAHSQTSGKSQSIGSKYNCVSCPENDKLHSMSSRVSSLSEKKSKRSDSSDICDHESTHGNVKETKQTGDPNNVDQSAKTSSKASDSEFECAYSPSPPKGHPAKRNLRRSKFKHSSSSVSSDQVKTFEIAEKMGSSRSSTPESKGVSASKDSIETCKKFKNTTNRSTEEVTNTKSRKNSTSSSKKKVHNESVDTDNKNHDELIPAALPNASSIEVVHEWLRKIPSGTLVADSEVEECPAKASQDTNGEMMEPITTKGAEERQISKDCIVETQISNPTQNEVNKALDKVKIEGKDERASPDKVQENNAECCKASVKPICHQKALPTTINTSVQIMKALLSPSQESKFDRSNSLPEVSPVMGRKLSNSAKALISCLDSLQLLDDGRPDPSGNSKEYNKPKYTELINIFQALWAEGPAKKCVKNVKSGKHYSREDEVTPGSSSGVDVNSGFGGSGDGSVIGGDCPATAVKAEESILVGATTDVKMINNITACNGSRQTLSEDEQRATDLKPTKDAKTSSRPGEANSPNVDENMNEKKIDPQDNNARDGEPPNDVSEHSDDNFPNVDGGLIGNLKQKTGNNDNLNNLNNADNNPQPNVSNSPETNCIDSPSDTQSTSISSADSNGKTEAGEDKQPSDADPVWVLKLLKKIEKEFMAHYVDAMNEFKVRWNLENNENLDEMIAELKAEVNERIQRSIANELKKIKRRAGQKVPRPPDEGSRRKSSLQAEERRKHLQTMRKRSVLLLANGDNRGNWTNDVSCETDEEDLTFSASFGDEINGQPNGEEFCPCETCIIKKRAFILSKPKAAVADAPIIRAFDLQQILKMKKEIHEVANEGIINSKVDECNKEMGEAIAEHGGTDVSRDCKNEEGSSSHSRLGDKTSQVKSECSAEEQEDIGLDDHASVEFENEDHSDDDFQGKGGEHQDITEEKKQDEGLEDEEQDANTVEKEECSTVNCPTENDTTSNLEETQSSDKETASSKLDDGHTVERDLESTMEDEEEKSTTEDGDEPDQLSIDSKVPEENNESKSISGENEATESNKEGNVSEDDEEQTSEGSQSCCLQKSYLGQHSVITRNGSADEGDKDFKGMNGSTGESSPNGQSNSSGSKQAQMYPDSSSDDEAGDSTCASPVGMNKNEAAGRVYVNNKGSFEESENTSKKDSQEEVIDQDDFDF